MGITFATIQLTSSLLASVSYLCAGDVWRSLYWLCAAAITIIVTFGLKGV